MAAPTAVWKIDQMEHGIAMIDDVQVTWGNERRCESRCWRQTILAALLVFTICAPLGCNSGVTGVEFLTYGMHAEKAGNIARAHQLYRKACDLELGEGCFRLALLDQSESMNAEASWGYLQACSNGFGQGCHRYAQLAEQSGNLGEAHKYYQIACDMKVGDGCYHLGRLDEALGK